MMVQRSTSPQKGGRIYGILEGTLEKPCLAKKEEI